ncbi:MAG: hypothetical protein RL518_2569 [Pseudomonadota bacterium]|jgi:hypothetical protein
MKEGTATKWAAKCSDYRLYPVIGLTLCVGILGLVAAFNAVLSPKHKPCTLMAGLCTNKLHPRRTAPLEEISKIRPEVARFGLSDPLRDRY